MRRAIVVVVVMGVAGCNGEVAGSGGVAPTVVAMTPLDQGVGLDPAIVIQATFSQDMDPATLDDTTFRVAIGSLVVSGTRTYDARTVTFTAAGPLGLLAHPTVTVTTGIKSTAGIGLAADATWSFTIRDGAFATALPVSNQGGNVFGPQIATDATGNAIAVWYQDVAGAGRTSIWASTFVPAVGWTMAGLVETDDVGDATAPDVAVDPAGIATAVWYQNDGTRNNIWANRYTPNSGWETPEKIETDDVSNAFDPRVAADAAGNVVAVWRQSDGTRVNIWANRYAVGTGWGLAQLLEHDDVGDADLPDVAIDDAGNALAVWQQTDGVRTDIFANRYVVGTGWSVTPTHLETGDKNASFARLAMSPAGDGVVVWAQLDAAATSNIWANRFSTSTGWGTAQLLEMNDVSNALTPQVALDGDGNALAVWSQSNGTKFSIWSNRLVATTGWGTPELVEVEDFGDALDPQVASDRLGNGIAVWAQYDGARNNLWANRFVAGTGWAGPARIETELGNANIPQVSIDPSGTAVAVWTQVNGTYLDTLSSVFH